MKNLITCIVIFSVLSVHISCKEKNMNSLDPINLFAEKASDFEMGGDIDWIYEDQSWVGKVDSSTIYLATNNTYKDFELTLEFYPDSTINSGVFVRCENKELSPDDCYELNIWDLHPNQDFRTGSIVKMALPLAKVETINKWNTYKIRCEKDRIQAWVNNILTVDLEDNAHQDGFIMLQAAGSGKVIFRNVKLVKN